MIKDLICSFYYSDSKYYLDDKFAESIEIATKYLLKIQHSDGTIDLLSTNFHSAPDTGFVVEPLCAGFQLLKEIQFERKEIILKLLEEFLKKAGEVLIAGGIHTPNHRWVICMALSRLNILFPNKKYVTRIEEWLQEELILMRTDSTKNEVHTFTPLNNF